MLGKQKKIRLKLTSSTTFSDEEKKEFITAKNEEMFHQSVAQKNEKFF